MRHIREGLQHRRCDWAYRSTKYLVGAVELHIKDKSEDIRCPKCEADHIGLKGRRERRWRQVASHKSPRTGVCRWMPDTSRDFLGPLDRHRDSHAPAHAEGGDAPPQVEILHEMK